MSNNFYNPSNPWMYNGAGVTNNTSGQINQGVVRCMMNWWLTRCSRKMNPSRI